MSATKHPERRAGQWWRGFWPGAFPAVQEFTITGVGFAGSWVCSDGKHWEDSCWSEPSVWTMALLSSAPAANASPCPWPLRGCTCNPNEPDASHPDEPTPQPSAPVVACKAPEWCGHRLPDALMRGYEMGTVRTTKGTSIVHCSPACRDSKHPPLAAQSAEAKIPLSINDCAELTKPAEQPKPAAKGPLCIQCKSDKVSMRITKRGSEARPSCDRCFLEREMSLFGQRTGILRDPAIPERLPRPRLAHSMNIEDPTLPEAR